MKNKSGIRWFLQAVGGLLLTGAGLSMAIDCGYYEVAGRRVVWIWNGGLACLSGGIMLSDRFYSIQMSWNLCQMKAMKHTCYVSTC
jgi:hypothetical protein